MLLNSDKNLVEPEIRLERGRLSNPELSFVNAPEGWTGNKVNEQNQFINIDSIHMPTFGDVLRWKTGKNPQKDEKEADTFSLDVIADTSFLNSADDVIVWLGHATFYIRIAGVSFITDPIFYNASIVKRKSALPFDPALIKNLNYILISHNHRDHCDKKSLKLLSQNNPGAVLLAGLSMKPLLSNWVDNKIQEAGWFQKYMLPSHISVVFLPAQHWSKRGLTDTNKRLWGSFFIEVGSKKLYFAGDTGWGSHFAYIGKTFGPIDVCFLPVGAYSPRWFMKSSHIDPQQAVEAFSQLKGKLFLPMHFGTFDLSDEPMGEPSRLVKEESGKLENSKAVTIQSVGQPIHF